MDLVTELDMWGRYDYIASISDSCTEAFLSKFPTLKDKIIPIDNIITNKMIGEQADMISLSKEMPEGNIRLLSVGRFSYAKNFDNIPEICKSIIDSGIEVRWYLIGFGGEEQLIRSQIEEFGMQRNVIILGKKENPYPYIKSCDLYVQPSRYEGKAVTVREAQMLHKPVIITDFPTAKAQLNNGYDGVIVPTDLGKCAKEIIEVIRDKNLQSKLIENMKHTNYSNEKEIQKIYDLIGE